MCTPSAGGKHPKMCESVKNIIINLYFEKDKGPKFISDVIGVSQSTVAKLIQQYKKDNDLPPGPRPMTWVYVGPGSEEYEKAEAAKAAKAAKAAARAAARAAAKASNASVPSKSSVAPKPSKSSKLSKVSKK